MKKIVITIIFIIVVLLPLSALAQDEWDRIDKYLFFSLTSSSVIDFLQTREALNSNKHKELNPLIKDKKTTFIYFSARTIGTLYGTNRLDSKNRKFSLSILLFSSLLTIGQNHCIGISIPLR